MSWLSALQYFGLGPLLIIAMMAIGIAGVGADAGAEAATNTSIDYHDKKLNMTNEFPDRAQVRENLSQSRVTTLTGTRSILLFAFDTLRYYSLAGYYMGYEYPTYGRWYAKTSPVGSLSLGGFFVYVRLRKARRQMEE